MSTTAEPYAPKEVEYEVHLWVGAYLGGGSAVGKLTLALSLLLAGFLPAASFNSVPSYMGASLAWNSTELKQLDQVIADNQVMLVGEVHGTQESPQFVSTIVHRALDQGRSVTVALEIPQEEQSVLQQCPTHDGIGGDLRSRLAKLPFWSSSDRDGRSSEAMLGLIDELHRLHCDQQKPVDLVAIDPKADGDTGSAPSPMGAPPRDQGMAEAVAKAIQISQGDHPLLVALTGNLHQKLQPGFPWDKPDVPAAKLYKPMGCRLIGTLDANTHLVALDVRLYGGGDAWICSGTSNCGKTPMPKRQGVQLADAKSPKVGLTVDQTDLAVDRVCLSGNNAQATNPKLSQGYYYFTMPVNDSPPANLTTAPTQVAALLRGAG